MTSNVSPPPIPDIIATKAHVDAVVDAFLSTGDSNIFSRHINAMMTESFAGSFAIMRGSGNELSAMNQFLTFAYDRNIISIDDVDKYSMLKLDERIRPVRAAKEIAKRRR